MKNDYLWDRSGKPDPQIQQLEKVLAKLQYRGSPPAFPAIEPRKEEVPARRMLSPPQFAALAAAASIILISAVALWRGHLRRSSEVVTDWGVASSSGTLRLGSQAIDKTKGIPSLTIGQTLETDSESRAVLTANGVGEVKVEPNTRLRILRSRPGRQQLALDLGTIHAFIWAPPGEFIVDTPSARAIDLGCTYTLHVDDSGAGLVRTTMGWVGFKLANRESFIPAGAVCATRPKIGPGTPYFEDAGESFRAALSEFDFKDMTAEQRQATLSSILTSARPRDGLTLWHLLARVKPSERQLVYERLAVLIPPPQEVTREGILRLDRPMLDAWWSKLGYGDASLWRTFERSWE